MLGVRHPPIVLGLCAGLVLAISGCGSATRARTPDLTHVPLTPGARVLASVRRCDRGANAFCAIQLVIADSSQGTSTALLHAERDHLRALGWTTANADNGNEHAADSPDHRLHLLYATAPLDLIALDLGWTQRAPMIARTLSQTMFDQSPALSLMLETGSS